MNNNKRTLDCYFASSTQKKTKPTVTQPEDDIIEDLTVQSCDTHIYPASGANDKLAESSSIDSAQAIDINNEENDQHEENRNNITSDSVIDISRSCQDPPAQPKLKSYPRNQDNRSFLAKWYDGRPWLEYSITMDSSYCYYCRHFGAPTSSSNKKPQTDAFLSNGFKNWKKALDKTKGFDQHLQSQGHILAASSYATYQQRERSQCNVIQTLDKGRIEQIRRNRERIAKIASALLLCSRQAIGIRGHDESER
jgi:hypothetical protein